MTDGYFIPGNILIPDKRQDMSLWSVIACDQFTSEPEYWERVEAAVGNAPSTLHLMLPEIYLKAQNIGAYIGKINKTMSDYLACGLFKEWRLHIFMWTNIIRGRLRGGC
jgi:hypothetical protein